MLEDSGYHNSINYFQQGPLSQPSMVHHLTQCDNGTQLALNVKEMHALVWSPSKVPC